MKQRLKQITKFMAVCALLVLSGCEKDLYDDGIQNENRKLIIRDISLKDLTDSKINSKILERVNDVKNRKNNPNGRIVYDSINDFYFDDEHGKYIEDGSYHSYTFPVYRENGDGKIEKLLFSLKLDGDYESYLVKYDFTEEEMNNFTVSEINQKGIEIKNISNKNGLLSLVCSYGYQFIEIYNTGNGGMTTADPGTHWEVVSTWYSCYPEYGIENVENGGAGTTGPSSSNGGGGGSSSGGTVGGGGSSSSTGTTIVTSPSGTHLTPSEKKFLSFISQLNQQSQDFLNDDENSVIRSNVRAYLVQNNFSSESVSFVNQCIIQMINNPGIFNSLNPFIIEKNIDESQLDNCSKGVFQQIKNTTNCDFAQVLAKLGAGKNYNTTMISAVPPNQRPGQTIWNSPYNYTIYISTNYSDKTKLFIATTELHELVHAYFMSLFDDYNNGNPSNPNAYNDFAILFQMYVNKTYPGSGAVAHHQQMATDYVNAIASALKEFQPGLDQQIYDDLAWGSLQEAPIFDTLFPVGSSNRERIINIYTSESIGSPYGQGTPNEQTPVGQPCN